MLELSCGTAREACSAIGLVQRVATHSKSALFERLRRACKDQTSDIQFMLESDNLNHMRINVWTNHACTLRLCLHYTLQTTRGGLLLHGVPVDISGCRSQDSTQGVLEISRHLEHFDDHRLLWFAVPALQFLRSSFLAPEFRF